MEHSVSCVKIQRFLFTALISRDPFKFNSPFAEGTRKPRSLNKQEYGCGEVLVLAWKDWSIRMS